MTTPEPTPTIAIPRGTWGTASISTTTNPPRTFTLTADPPTTEWVPVHIDVLKAHVDTANELEQLRDAVWNDGQPWAWGPSRDNSIECCWFCEADHNEPHTDTCPWILEAERRDQ